MLFRLILPFSTPPFLFSATAIVITKSSVSEILTNILSTNEQSLVSVLSIISIAWCAFLLFCGMLTIHQYSIGKTILTIIVSIVAIFAVLFLVILLYNLLQQMIIFVISMYNEIIVRM